MAFFAYSGSNASIFISQQNGNWTDVNTWEEDSTTYPASRTPQGGDTVIIKAIHTVLVTANLNLTSGGIMLIQVEGTLEINGAGSQLRLASGSGLLVVAPSGSVEATGGGGASSKRISIGPGPADWDGGDGPLGPGDSLGTVPTFPLPVSWVKVEVNRFENSHNILWATAEEEFESHFEILRSEDLKTWNKIGEIESKGSGEYNFIHDAYNIGFSYYRVRFVEINGSSSLSKIVSIFSESASNQIDINVYPNPCLDFVFVEGLDISSAVSQITNVNSQIIDSQMVLEQNKIKLDLNSLNPGVYFLKVSDYKSSKSLRIVKN